MAKTFKSDHEKRTWMSWISMIQRCYTPTNRYYKDYGGRGIKVCSQWINNLDQFIADMGYRPENRTIDRIDNSGDYCASNCKWSTHVEQANNRRNNHLVTFNNKTMTISQWAREIKIKPDTLFHRIITKKIPLERALCSGYLDGKLFKHGTNNGYNSGCRCDSCKDFNRRKAIKYRLKIKEKCLYNSQKESYHNIEQL